MPSYSECLIEAARVVMGELLTATESEEGVSAFQYILPDRANVWGMSISGGESKGLAGCAVTSLLMNARIEGRFSTVEGAQRFALQVASVAPVRNSGVVESFHLTAPPEITAQVETLTNSTRPALFYRVTVPCAVAFTVADG